MTNHPVYPGLEGFPGSRTFSFKTGKVQANWEELVTLLQDPTLSLVMEPFHSHQVQLREVSCHLAQGRQMLRLDQSTGLWPENSHL